MHKKKKKELYTTIQFKQTTIQIRNVTELSILFISVSDN